MGVWLAGCRAGWLAGRFTGIMAGCLAGCLAGWLGARSWGEMGKKAGPGKRWELVQGDWDGEGSGALWWTRDGGPGGGYVGVERASIAFPLW